MMLPNQPLGYESPAPGTDPSRRRFSPGIFVATLGVMLLLTGILTLVLPRVEVVYKDFGVALPAVTVAVLRAGHSIGGVAAWVVAIPLSVATAFVVATLPVGGRILRLALTLVLAAVVLVIALALFLPMLSLTTSVQQATPAAKP